MAYLAVLILVLIITISGLAFLQLGELERRLGQEEERSAQALAAAQGGIRRVAWALAHLPALQSANPAVRLNPFHPDWYSDPANPRKDTALMDLVNPKPGEPFYPALGQPYNRIASLEGAETQVRLRLLGAVDTNGDGIAGLGDRDGDGYPDLADADPQDTNRFLDVFLGLPGCLGQNVSVAASGVVGSSGEAVQVSRVQDTLDLVKAFPLRDFYATPPVVQGGRNYYPAVFSHRFSMGTCPDGSSGGIQLPKGMFNAGVPDLTYFDGLPGIHDFDRDRTIDATWDPTHVAPSGAWCIVRVRGNLVVRSRSWGDRDVVLVATGDITVEDLDTGWEGRVVLVGRDVVLKGTLEKWVNGVVVAGRDVRLLSFESPDAWSAAPQSRRYLFVSMIAAGDVKLESNGWALVFDRWVVSGRMGERPAPYVMARFEDEIAEPLKGCWSREDNGSAPLATAFSSGQAYLDCEKPDIENTDANDAGSDGKPAVLRITVRPQKRATGEEIDSAVGESVALYLDGSVGAGCQTGTRDWRDYGSISLYMVLDNYSREGAGIPKLVTEREAKFRLLLSDEAGNERGFLMTGTVGDPWDNRRYRSGNWGKASYDYDAGTGDIVACDASSASYASRLLPQWKRVEIPFAAFGGPLDLSSLRKISIRLQAFEVRWYQVDDVGSIVPGTENMLRDNGGMLQFLPAGATGWADVRREVTGDPNSPLQYKVSETSWDYIRWDEDKNGIIEAGERLREEHLRITMRVDRVMLPGATRKDYGLPPFELQAVQWRELTADEAAR